MTRKMIINAMDPDEVRIAILNNGVLEEFDIEARGIEKNKGNIYKGLVMAVEPALNAAFVAAVAQAPVVQPRRNCPSGFSARPTVAIPDL
jgi:hypothetical protein